jgi:hypothetical protein
MASHNKSVNTSLPYLRADEDNGTGTWKQSQARDALHRVSYAQAIAKEP